MAAPFSYFKLDNRRTFLARHRVPLTLAAAIAAIVLAGLRGLSPHRPTDLGDPISLAGTLLVLLGVAWRSWAAAILIKGRVLATEGPYDCCRHPLYAGSFAMLLGYCSLCGSLLLGVLPLMTALATYPVAIVEEERRLASRFPTVWADYARRVPRLLPRRFPQALGPVSWQRWLLNGEHRGATAGLLGLLGVELWHAIVAR